MQRKTISPYDITSSDNPGSKGCEGVKANVVQASTTEVIGCFVGLPNGNQISATKEGTMVFNNKLPLNHVLYMPSLMCNLISLSQLIDETNCVAQFTKKFCVQHDRTLGMQIGAVFCELEFPYKTNTGSNNWNGGNEIGDVVVLPQDNNDIIVEIGNEECDIDEARGCNVG
ncbi:hypothetical protein V6N11_071703 [Hibiscus sabdariffa]|uniref:Uncharacterized protein n=1 Tax=Hibiscus sabdariffa TaxID=183260 RepID=A0ABR2U1N3_9ROSI